MGDGEKRQDSEPEVVPFVLDGPAGQLYRTDRLLDELERLNIEERRALPVRLGRRLEEVGLERPYHHSIPDLIEMVFDRQDDILKAVVDAKQRERLRRAGWRSRAAS